MSDERAQQCSPCSTSMRWSISSMNSPTARRPARSLRRSRANAALDRHRRIPPSRRRGQLGAAPARRHVHRVLRQPRYRAHLAVRPDPAHRARRRVVADQARHRAARSRAQRVSRRRLRSAAHPARRPDPGRDGVLVEVLRPRDDRVPRTARRLHPRLGHRPDPRARRYLLRPRGQPAHAVRHLVRARKPRRAQALVSAPVRTLSAAAGRRLPAPAARRTAPLGAGRSRAIRRSCC